MTLNKISGFFHIRKSGGHKAPCDLVKVLVAKIMPNKNSISAGTIPQK